MACIYMLESAVMYHKARHIDTRVYHLRELCKNGELKLVKVECEADRRLAHEGDSASALRGA